MKALPTAAALLPHTIPRPRAIDDSAGPLYYSPHLLRVRVRVRLRVRVRAEGEG